jgi:hypothetical protein
MESVSLYSEARNEYLKQMASWLSSPMVEFFRGEYQKISSKDSVKAMSAFQAWCADVPKWNQDVIDTNVATVLDTCRCDYVEELMTAVFIAHTKMLTAIRVSSKQKKMKITLPKLDHFLHRVFIECARGFWKAPFLFLESVPMIEKQKNVLQMESMCIEALSGAVRSLLPVKSILNEYLAEDEEDKEEEEEEEEKVEVKEEKPKSKKTKASLPLPSTIPAAATVAAATVPPTIAAAAFPREAGEGSSSESSSRATGLAAAATADATVPSTITAAFSREAGEGSSNESSGKAAELTAAAAVLPSTVSPSLVIKEDHSAILPPLKEGAIAEKVDENRLQIDTEPSVHFTPYDTVFDETNESVSEIRYTPKISSEDKPDSHWGEDDPLQRIQIGSEGTSLSMDDMEDLEAPVEDVDAPLSSLGEFEELS